MNQEAGKDVQRLPKVCQFQYRAAETPLVRIVRIRSEKDGDVLRHFTKEQHRIRNDWIKKKRYRGRSDTGTIEERDRLLKQLADMFRKRR